MGQLEFGGKSDAGQQWRNRVNGKKDRNNQNKP